MWKITADYKMPYQRKGTEESVFCISCIPQTLNLGNRRIAESSVIHLPVSLQEMQRSVIMYGLD